MPVSIKKYKKIEMKMSMLPPLITLPLGLYFHQTLDIVLQCSVLTCNVRRHAQISCVSQFGTTSGNN